MRIQQTQILDLYFKALSKHPFLKISDQYKLEETGRLMDFISTCRNQGLYEPFVVNEKLEALFLYNNLSLKVIYNPNYTSSLDWLVSQLEKHRQSIKKDTQIKLLPGQEKLIQLFCNHGFHIRFIFLMGLLSKAEESFSLCFEQSNILDQNNIKIEELQTEKQLDRIMDIWEYEMKHNPQFHSPGDIQLKLDDLKQKINHDIGSKPAKRFVLIQKRKIVGYFGFDIWNNVTDLGNVGGSDLCFSKEIQGKGIVKDIYKKMFQEMQKHNIHYISGGTAQKSVMALSKIMGRKITGYNLVYNDGFFPIEYFDI